MSPRARIAFPRRLLAAAAASALAVAALAAPLRAAVVSTFDTNTDGWLIVGDNSAGWLPTGGNPGGCLDVNDLVTGQMNYASAPARFLGDWSAMGAADSLAVDLFFVNTSGGTLLTASWLFRIAGPGGSAVAFTPFPAPVQGAWTTYAVSLHPADWQLESGTWSALLAQVQSLKLVVEYVNGAEEVHVDNVRLTRSPVAAFAPCVTSLFPGSDLDDWSAANTTVSNPGARGTGGGYLNLSNTSAQDGYALAPARYQGDWSPLDGNGVVTLDLRIVAAGTAPTGSAAFVRLSGPGGAAHVPLAAADLPRATLLWKRFTFPIAESAWVLDSGTWAGLLADVQEMRLHANLFTGAEQVGFDNVGRLRSDCPPLDETMVLHDAGTSLCAVTGFVAPGGLALDPASGVLHGLSREGTSDGVYRLTGEAPGLKLRTYDRPSGIVFDHDGDGFVSEDYNGNIFRFVGAESSMVWVSGLHAGDDDPYGMALAPPGFAGPNVSPGDVLVADRGNAGPDEVWAFSPDLPELEVLLAPDPGNVDWFDIAASPDGRVWLADALVGNALTRLYADGTRATLALGSNVGTPVALAWDARDSVLYLSALAPPALYRVDPDDGAVTLVADGFSSPAYAGLEVDSDARRLWLADRGRNRIYEFCLPGIPAAVGDGPRRGAFALRSAPNPFRSSTTIAFVLPAAARACVEVFDLGGRRVARLHDGPLAAGEHALRWDGRDAAGRATAPGIYLARLTALGRSVSHRVMLLR